MPSKKPDIETFTPASRQDWRKWLTKNHRSKQSIWLIYHKKTSTKPTITYSDAVDEALCFGWIDSTTKSIDSETYIQYFCKRKPTSVWSKVNKAKVQKLVDQGLMTAAGMESIEIAKQNGTWSILDDVEEVKVPPDLAKAFRLHKGSKQYFESLSRSTKKILLQWIVLAKRKETRQKRIDEIAELAGIQLKPKQFR
ncbi:MAG: YdeI/OmpD-associated family protein [Chitinophagaceae bacterium]|nr:YdeI/OmpD-associated family protein [Chitinophagaceae bacterium]